MPYSLKDPGGEQSKWDTFYVVLSCYEFAAESVLSCTMQS